MAAKNHAPKSQHDLSIEAVDETVKILVGLGFTRELALETLAIQLHENLSILKETK
jgi:hypothetical protein